MSDFQKTSEMFDKVLSFILHTLFCQNTIFDALNTKRISVNWSFKMILFPVFFFFFYSFYFLTFFFRMCMVTLLKPSALPPRPTTVYHIQPSIVINFQWNSYSPGGYYHTFGHCGCSPKRGLFWRFSSLTVGQEMAFCTLKCVFFLQILHP